MNTTESPKRKISALERTIVAGMGSITMPDMMALHKKFPTLTIEDIYDILSSIETSALGTTPLAPITSTLYTSRVFQMFLSG